QKRAHHQREEESSKDYLIELRLLMRQARYSKAQELYRDYRLNPKDDTGPSHPEDGFLLHHGHNVVLWQSGAYHENGGGCGTLLEERVMRVDRERPVANED
ncbi:hypothetical protein AWZ03_014835, partial [Drosophila navojoa]